MNNSCPQCGVAYTVSGNLTGRRFDCKQCKTPLVVQPTGIELAEAEVSPVVESVTPRSSRPAGDRMAGVKAFFKRVADTPTWLFGVGLFLSLYYVFCPSIDEAKLDRRRAAIAEADLDAEREESTDKEKLAKEKKKLEQKLEETEISVQRSAYWYRWGLLAGIVLLALGSVGFLQPQQPLLRRVVGCSVLLALVLLVLLNATRVGVRLEAGPRGAEERSSSKAE